ncbi:Ectonucleotide pyrophosphatase/phosphodiesterase family member 3 [Mizuhopecten yessoensis]|uniref:Ectonucleotide pyrophosphatase/phosphodiesterase family member 3 n=1 Tax=Mizuhopecten yessoensis TaxID=6573 RepID=A0A210PHH4_MIZYE|nr:Ectonucleotide pyrophosphatase/phosphodiesterase family member 3 [Mizuhopecten yessoensis]
MGRNNFQLQVIDGDTNSRDGSTYQLVGSLRLRKRRNRYIYIGLFVATVCGLAIGLGLGLGLQKHNDNASNTNGVGSAAKSQKIQQNGESTKGPLPVTVAASVPPPTTTTVAKETVHPSTKTTKATTLPTLSTVPTTSSPPGLTTHKTGAQTWMDQPCEANKKSCPWHEGRTPPLLLVSLDGFRAEYLHRNMTPTIERLRDCGVHTPYMRATYPTLTFPNHYTIVTGLYPESHGIVDNNMYDPVINQTFTLYGSVKYGPQWWGGEPIWTTAKKQGKKSASMFWVGSDVNISGIQPDTWRMYDGSVTFEERVDTVLGWLSLTDDQRPDLITLYFDEPDHSGHGSGPVSSKVNSMLTRVDQVIARLMEGLYSRDIHNCVNLIILADHGMEATSCDRKVELSTYVKTNEVLVFDGTIGRVHKDFHQQKIGKEYVVVKNTTVMTEAALLKRLECKSGHFHAFSQQDIPVRHHYSNNPRIGDVILDVQAKWTVSRKRSSFCLQGNHGYDNLYKSMQALFLAHGPGFKVNYTTKPFENIELYNMMSDLLEIVPSSNNGTTGSLDDMLKNPQTRDQPNLSKCPKCNTHIAIGPQQALCGCDNMLPTSTTASVRSYTPLFGAPVTTHSGLQICELDQGNFRTGYSKLFHTPVWSTFTLTRKQNVSLLDDACVLLDQRLPKVSCDSYHGNNITQVFLYNPGFDTIQTESRLHTNTVPMYRGFYSGIWRYVWTLISDYNRQSQGIQVTAGPVFDHNSDGLWEGITNSTRFVDAGKTVAIPSHYFIILVRCSEPLVNVSSCDVDKLDTMTFIIPHLDREPNCLPDEDYLAQHVARIRDVELQTGLDFFSDLDVVRSVKLRTHLATQVWAVKDLALHWSELACSDHSTGQCKGKKPLLLISLDGFRADYIQRNITPVIHKMRQCGVHTPYMRATFPTVTFPNHYTIVTGLYPESHGIISNKMYDEHIGKYFTLGSWTKMDPRWWGGEPIWITAKKQNKKTATYFWPGSDVNISGTYPDYWKPYKGSAGYPERVSEVLDWLTMPENEKPDMVTLYFDQPDHAGHQQGPESGLLNERLRTMDMMVGRLMDGLYQQNLHDCVNIIIIADHGFDDTSCNQIVDLSKHINTSQVLISSGTFGRIETKYSGPRKNIKINENPVPVSALVDKLMCNTSVMKVFTKETAPKRFHYLNNPRVGDILLDMADRWLVSTNSYYSNCDGGNHGWDNIFKSMHALFLAHGPAFKQNMTIRPFENIELYNLMSELLDIDPAPNNGTLGTLDHVLVKNSTRGQLMMPQVPVCQSGQVPTPSLCGQNQSSPDLHLPRIVLNQTSVCQLNYPKQITVYDTMLKSPLYTTFTLTDQMVRNTSSEDVCIMDRLENLWLYQPNYPHFYTEIWNFTRGLIKQYALQYGNLTVTLGPVYDHDGDGLADTNRSSEATGEESSPSPSHVFVVMMRCALPGQVYPCGGDDASILIQSLVLPYLNFTPNCLYLADYLKDNIARVRDVELLTGLNFFVEGRFSVSEAARLRTHLSEKLWPSQSLRTWLDSPCPVAEDSCTSSYRPLILISLDGFRADYLLRNFTPYIGRLSRCGTRAPYMRSVFPTKTFPNHYSIVTGLYPESHGIVDNSMFDSNLDSTFKIGGSAFNQQWWQGEPIWRTVMNNNKTAATFFWPGSDVKVNGTYPTYFRRYDQNVAYDNRVQQVLNWVTNEKPDLITLYFDEPDQSGHKYGPDNIVKIGLALERVDAAIGQLMEGLMHRGLHNCVNILLIADHGMSSISCDRLVLMEDYLSNTTLSKMHLFPGTFGRINNLYSQKTSRSKLRPVSDPVPTTDIMTNLTCHPHFKVFTKTTLPKRHHYANNPRIDDIIIDVEDEWLVTDRPPKRSARAFCTGGSHGYDNTYKSMQALFLAHGPVFNQNLTVKSFENIELYNLMTDVLGIRPAPNNGTEGSLNHVLRNPRPMPTATPIQNYTDWTMGTVIESFIQESLRYRSQCLDRCSITTNTNQTKVNTEDQHVLFGRPSLQISHTQTSVYIKSYPSHVTAYSTSLLAPLWVSYTQTSSPSPEADYPTCILRGLDRPQCEATSFTQNSRQYTWTPLYRTAVTYSWESLISLNFVPMLENFRRGIWRSVQNLTDRYTQDYGVVNVMTGPIFDYNTDGHKDEPTSVLRRNTTVSIPTHFFYIISRCDDQNLTTCPPEHLITLSFILPHTDSITNCQGERAL